MAWRIIENCERAYGHHRDSPFFAQHAAIDTDPGTGAQNRYRDHGGTVA